MIQKLRYFVFEVPKEFWILNLPCGPVPLWDSEEYKRHQPCYSGPLGQFYSAVDATNNIVSFVFEVKSELPRSPPIIWWTNMNTSDLKRDVDDIRTDLVAEISLEADPPIRLRSPQDAHLESSDVSDDSIVIA